MLRQWKRVRGLIWFASWFDIHAKLWEKPKTEYEGPSKICLHVRSLRVIIPKCRIAPNHGSKTMPKIMSSRRWLQNHAPWSGTREFCQCSFGEAKILTGPHIFYFYNIWYYIYLCTYVYMYIFVTCIFNITSSKFAGITVVFLHIAVHATFGNIDMWLIWRHRFGEFLFAPFWPDRTSFLVFSYIFLTRTSCCLDITKGSDTLSLTQTWTMDTLAGSEKQLDGVCFFSIPYWPILASVWQWTFKVFQGIQLLRIVSNNSLEAFDEDFGKTLPNLTVLMAETGFLPKWRGRFFRRIAGLKSRHY